LCEHAYAVISTNRSKEGLCGKPAVQCGYALVIPEVEKSIEADKTHLLITFRQMHKTPFYALLPKRRITPLS
jgi:hypothetical protein